MCGSLKRLFHIRNVVHMCPNSLLWPFNLIKYIFQIKAKIIILRQYIEYYLLNISISDDPLYERRWDKKDVRRHLRSGFQRWWFRLFFLKNDVDSIAESDEDLPYEVDEDAKFIVAKWLYNTYNKGKTSFPIMYHICVCSSRPRVKCLLGHQWPNAIT